MYYGAKLKKSREWGKENGKMEDWMELWSIGEME